MTVAILCQETLSKSEQEERFGKQFGVTVNTQFTNVMLSAWIKIIVTLADGSNRSGGVSLIKEVIEIPTDTADDTVNYVTDAAESSQCYCCGTGLTSKY